MDQPVSWSRSRTLILKFLLPLLESIWGNVTHKSRCRENETLTTGTLHCPIRQVLLTLVVEEFIRDAVFVSAMELKIC